MDNTMLTDLKGFIATTLDSVLEKRLAGLATKKELETLRAEYREQFATLTHNINRKFDENEAKHEMILNEILNAIGKDYNELSTSVDSHEQRITTLERSIA